MACLLSKGIKLDCSNNTGGVEAIWITAVDDIATLTVQEVDGSPTAGDGTVTALTMDATKSFLKFETLRKNYPNQYQSLFVFVGNSVSCN